MTSEAGALGLICTKLRRPRLPGDLIYCQRLPSRLDAGLDRNLTVISARAGYRNTTLISEPVDQASLIGVINHVDLLDLQPLPVECVSAPLENWPVMGAIIKHSDDNLPARATPGRRRAGQLAARARRPVIPGAAHLLA